MRLLGQFQTFYFYFTKRFHKYKTAYSKKKKNKKNVYKKHPSSDINEIIKTI